MTDHDWQTWPAWPVSVALPLAQAVMRTMSGSSASRLSFDIGFFAFGLDAHLFFSDTAIDGGAVPRESGDADAGDDRDVNAVAGEEERDHVRPQ